MLLAWTHPPNNTCYFFLAMATGGKLVGCLDVWMWFEKVPDPTTVEYKLC